MFWSLSPSSGIVLWGKRGIPLKAEKEMGVCSTMVFV